MPAFTIDQDRFAIDGKPLRILSGAMHYFRVLPEYWDDRMEKMRAMGLNALETYVAWDLHEPRPGQFHFAGWLDLSAYLRKAADHGLYTLLRPGPYICSEWEFGGLPDVFKTVNFGSRAGEAFAKLRDYQSERPLACMEFWNGWFDHWGEEHHHRPPEEAAEALDEILSENGSVNFYMIHGGTNFGFMNGANCQQGQYQPTVTSYDDDAPLDEAGDPTPKYFALREVIGRHVDLPGLPLPRPAPKMALEPFDLAESTGLFDALDALSTPLRRPTPEPMEALGQDYGFILYTTRISGPRAESPLTLRQLRDRALVFLDGRLLGTLEREFPERKLSFAVPPGGATLEILVENMGRINYGPDLLDRKGITEGVILGQQYLYDWAIRPLPLADLTDLTFSAGTPQKIPAFFRATFTAPAEIRDSFLALPGWTKGVAWLNRFNLGRYWDRGPQRTLYAPAPLFKKGENELILFELHDPGERRAEFRDSPDLG